MKAKIDKNGVLYIERAGIFKEQYCRIAGIVVDKYNNKETYNCKDTCPLFGEPEYIDTNTDLEGKPNYKVKISLCQKDLIIESKSFTDERVSQ